MAIMHLALAAEIQGFEPSAIITLFEMHLDGEIHRFHAGTNEFFKSLVWQGNEYMPFPIEAEGFELTSQGSLPRPTLTVSNVQGVISELLLQRDIAGAKIVRRRTLARYLDAVNFKDGNENADPTAELPSDVFFIDMKKNETSATVEFELRSSLELNNTSLPRRQIIQNACPWRYRSGECSYSGGPVGDILDNPTDNPALDQCGKKLKSCKMRFPDGQVLPFGGFPAAGLVRT